jgi:hypothetical protein
MQDQRLIGSGAQSAITVELDELSRQDFGDRVGQLMQGFQNRFGKSLTITGTDTADHIRLYGRGLAADIRTHGLGREHLDWLGDQTKELGLSGRDYSWLTGPVTTSTGVRLTGPHFHVDYGGDESDYGAVPPVKQGWRSPGGQGLVKASSQDLKQAGGDYSAVPPVKKYAAGQAGQNLIKTGGDDLQHGAGDAHLTNVSGDTGSKTSSARGQRPPAVRNPVVRRGSIASVTITPDSQGRVVEN